MRLILHQMKKDLRAERWLVAAWAVALAAACAMEALKLDVPLWAPDERLSGPGASGSGASVLSVARLALVISRVVLGWVLAIRIVHADPLDATSAFWLTRPLSPRMLLAAKGGLIGVLLLAVPGAATLVVFVMNGVAIGTIPGALGQWLLLEAVLLLPIVLDASLTRDVARMVLTLLAGLGAWWVLQISCWTASMVPVEAGAAAAWLSRIAQAWLVVFAGVVVLSATLIARQYLTRRTSSIAVAALVAAVGMVGIAALGPGRLMVEYRNGAWDAEDTPLSERRWRGDGALSVTLPAESLRLLTAPARIDRLVGDLRIDGLEEGVIVSTEGGRGTLRFAADGTIVEQRRSYASGFGVGPSGMADAASYRNFERVLGARLIDPREARWSGLRLVEFKPGDAAARRGSRASYDATLVFDAYRVQVAAVVPFRAGASWQAGGVSTTIMAIRKERGTGWVIEFRESIPRGLLTGDAVRIERFVRNPQRGEAMELPSAARDGRFSALSSTSVLAARRTGVIQDNIGLDANSSGEAWLADAEVVIISFERLARFTKRVAVSNFVLPGADDGSVRLPR
jgi:hypothetical protein